MNKLIILILFLSLSYQVKAQQFFSQDTNLLIIESFGNTIFGGGGGISFVDFNGDGYDDITLGTEAGKEILFYENKITHFELLSPGFVSFTDETKQIVWVDFDNDNDKDLFLSSFDGKDKLFENDGSMNFQDVTVAVGLPDEITDCYVANFGDLNKDGWLDLYIGRYGEEMGGNTNSLYRYNPVVGVYQDFTAVSGVSNGPLETLATTFFDFDMDGDLDIYVSNDRVAHPNTLYMNLGFLTFVDVGVPTGTNATIDAMNAGVADYDGNGFFDIYITDTQTSVMYKNQGTNYFTNEAVSSGTTFDRYGWGGNFLDYDNDRDEDLYVCTSSVASTDVNAFYVNDGTGVFTEPFLNTNGLAGKDDKPSFTNATGDFNNDGKTDLMVSKDLDNGFSLFANHEDNDNHFVKLHLEGVDSNKDAYGAMLEFWVNGTKTIHQKHSVNGFQSQHSDDMILGLGNTTTIDSLVIHWPYANNKTVLYDGDLLIDGMNIIEEGTGVISTSSLEICDSQHDIQVNPVHSQTYGASINLDCHSDIKDGSIVLFQAEQEINLGINFTVEAGAEFTAEINQCGN